MKLFRALVLVVFLCGPCALAQFEVGIVLPFENNSRDPNLDWIGESFVEVLSANLASPRFMMLDRRDRAAAFENLGIPNTSILSHATIYKVAEALDADKLILGSYDYKDGVFKAVARVLQWEGPRLSQKFTETGSLEDLMELQTGLAWQVQRFLRPAGNISKSDFLKLHHGPRLDAFENYLRGLTSGSRAEQIRYYRTAQRLDSRFTKPAFALGMIYFHDRDYPTSVLWLAKLRPGDADYLEANYFLGLAYLYLEQYEASAAAFRVVAQKLPLNEVYNNLGIALMRQDRPGAVSYFEKAVQSNPTDPDYQFNLGYAYWKRGSYEQAVPHLQIALQEANEPAWRVIYMQCLEKTGQEEQRAQEEQLLQDQSEEFTPTTSGSLLEKLERPKDNYDGTSFRQLRILIQLQAELKHAKLSLPEHVALHFQRGQRLLQEGSDREATAELQQVIDYDPEHAEAYRELAGIYLRAGRLEQALQAAKQSLRLEKTAESYLLLARVYLEQGKLEEAERQLNAALRLQPASSAAAALRQELDSRNAESP